MNVMIYVHFQFSILHYSEKNSAPLYPSGTL